jgi:hypothetical protein
MYVVAKRRKPHARLVQAPQCMTVASAMNELSYDTPVSVGVEIMVAAKGPPLGCKALRAGRICEKAGVLDLFWIRVHGHIMPCLFARQQQSFARRRDSGIMGQHEHSCV